MTPVSTRPSLDDDRTYFQIGAFQNAYLTEKTCKQIQALSAMLGVAIELVPVYERRPIVPADVSGAEVTDADF